MADWNGERPWRTDAEIVARAQERLDRYNLSDVRGIPELTRKVSASTGKAITVEEVDDPVLVTTTALWIEFKDRSLILLRRHDPAYYRARGLFHEFGHIVFGHPACTALTNDPQMARYAAGGGEVRGRVLISEANLPALYRNDMHESEAEAVAALIGRRLLRPRYEGDEEVFG